MKYVISSKSNVLVPNIVDTKNSRYPVLTFRAFRKFASRAAARSYKRSLNNPREYVIVDTHNQMVVR